MPTIIGWDVGGAHLKAVRTEKGQIVAAEQFPSPLWQGLTRLTEAFGWAKAHLGNADLHVVTMTGELADAFASRSEGVDALTKIAVDQLLPSPILIYAGRAGMISPEQVKAHIEDIASANWHASASLLARLVKEALLVDMGSTTTDIAAVQGGTLLTRGYSDFERLGCGELVYTGLVRTFVMAVAERAPIAGQWVTLMNEYFANMADVYRLLDRLPANSDQMETADGRPKNTAASAARLARIVGRDSKEETPEAWSTLAQWFAEQQVRDLTDAAMLILSRGDLSSSAPIVAAGIGDAVIFELARRLQRPAHSFAEFLPVAAASRAAAARCAPAAAVALLVAPT